MRRGGVGAGVAAVATVTLLIEGCGAAAQGPTTESSQPGATAVAVLPLDDALSGATSLRRGVLAALFTQYPQLTWSDEVTSSLTAQPDGRCVLAITGPSSTDDLYHRSDRLRAVPHVLAPALSAAGYEAAEPPQEWSAGGGVDVAANGPAGWKFVLTAKGSRSYLRQEGPVVADPCDTSALAGRESSQEEPR